MPVAVVSLAATLTESIHAARSHMNLLVVCACRDNVRKTIDNFVGGVTGDK
jgi:hypothetical protein